MKLHFEPNLLFQLDAINSVVRLFEGQPAEESMMEFNLQEEGAFNFVDGIANKLILSEEQLFENLQRVQQENEIQVSSALNGLDF